MLFIRLIYSCFSHYHVPTIGIAPFSVYKLTHTQPNSSIHSDEGLVLQMSALKLSTVANLFYQLS